MRHVDVYDGPRNFREIRVSREVIVVEGDLVESRWEPCEVHRPNERIHAQIQQHERLGKLCETNSPTEGVCIEVQHVEFARQMLQVDGAFQMILCQIDSRDVGW
uniref:Uncharacterized protein n=1 Tax=Paramoeba aestuarina TaxID=180227 RepID=A0A7S4NR40_9EUKA